MNNSPEAGASPLPLVDRSDRRYLLPYLPGGAHVSSFRKEADRHLPIYGELQLLPGWDGASLRCFLLRHVTDAGVAMTSHHWASTVGCPASALQLSPSPLVAIPWLCRSLCAESVSPSPPS
eukprot:scaffold287165_cov36-Tisochrysis_lutea.AAC.1